LSPISLTNFVGVLSLYIFPDLIYAGISLLFFDGVDMSSVKKKRKYKIAKHKRKKRSRRDRHKTK
jgi:hypothetical protein